MYFGWLQILNPFYYGFGYIAFSVFIYTSVMIIGFTVATRRYHMAKYMASFPVLFYIFAAMTFNPASGNQGQVQAMAFSWNSVVPSIIIQNWLPFQEKGDCYTMTQHYKKLPKNDGYCMAEIRETYNLKEKSNLK